MDFQGSSLMPLFFLLSGFSLAVTAKNENHSSKKLQTDEEELIVVNKDSNHEENNEKHIESTSISDFKMSKSRFYQNRIARVIPMYYLGLALAFPLCFVGFNYMAPSDTAAIIKSTVVSVVPVSTLLCFGVGFVLDGPGWTVCTLLLMWLAFPHALAGAHALSDAQLVGGGVQTLLAAGGAGADHFFRGDYPHECELDRF
jgi:peptidoglycan/LPS O-acetylase OafA/YrhL